MKRILMLLLALAVTAGCTAKPQKDTSAGDKTALWQKPPALTVQAGESEGLAAFSTYSWTWPNGNGTDTGLEADGPHPLDMLSYMTPLPLAGRGTVTLRFQLDGLTLDKMTVRRWDLASAGDSTKYESDFEMLSFTAAGDTVSVDLPDGRGGIFEVHAYFTGESHGDGYYCFCLREAAETAAAFTGEKVRIGWRESMSELPQVRVICTRETLKSALATETAQTGRLPDRDEGFFRDHELLLILLEEGSGSITHEVTDVLTGSDGATVTVRRIVPEVCTADMAAWLLFVDLAAGTVTEEAPVTVKVQ